MESATQLVLAKGRAMVEWTKMGRQGSALETLGVSKGADGLDSGQDGSRRADNRRFMLSNHGQSLGVWTNVQLVFVRTQFPMGNSMDKTLPFQCHAHAPRATGPRHEAVTAW